MNEVEQSSEDALTGYHSIKGFKLAFKKQYGDINFEKI